METTQSKIYNSPHIEQIFVDVEQGFSLSSEIGDWEDGSSDEGTAE